MVTPPINTMQAFDSYYSGNAPKTNSKESNALQIALVTGIILTTACAVYFAIKNNNLRKLKSIR